MADDKVTNLNTTGRVAPMNTVKAYAVSPPLFQQVVELIRGHVCHRDADPVLQQLQGAPLMDVNLEGPPGEPND